MGSPYERNKYYFIQTITFYYVAKFERIRGGMAIFTDVGLIKNVDDWDQFMLTKGRGQFYAPSIILNPDAIVAAVAW